MGALALAEQSRGEVAGSPQIDVERAPILPLAAGVVILGWALTTRAMQLGHAPRNAWSLNPGASLLLFVLLLGVGPYAGGMLVSAVGITTDQLSLQSAVVWSIGVFTVQMFFIGLLVAAERKGLFAHTGHNADDESILWMRAPLSRTKSALVGALALALAWFPLQVIGSLASSVEALCGGRPPPAEGHSTFELLRSSPSDAWRSAMVSVVLVCAPITEELAFRGGLLRALRMVRVPVWTAIAATSTLFAAVHVPALADGAMASGLTTLFALAMVLGWLMERTGRIIAPIVAHSLFNLINLILFFTA